MLLLVVVLSIFVYGMVASTLGTILPNLSTRFQLTPAQNGTIAFSQALGLILSSLAAGPLLDIEGKKLGLTLGLVFVVLALAFLPSSKGRTQLLVLMGAGDGTVVTAADAPEGDPKQLRFALLIIPASALLMVGLSVAQCGLHR